MHEEVEPMGISVATVLQINGPRLNFVRKLHKGRARTYQAYEGMQIFANDHLITDSNTTVMFRFHIGGVTTVVSQTHVVVKGHRKVFLVGGFATQFTARVMRARDMLDHETWTSQIRPYGNGGLEG